MVGDHYDHTLPPATRPRSYSITVEFSINDAGHTRAPVAFSASPDDARIVVAVHTDEVVNSARRYSGLYELRFSLKLAEACRTAGNLLALVRFPWQVEHYLGPLTSTADGVASARLVARVPAQVELVLRVDQCIPTRLAPPRPCAMLLKEHVKVILENDEFCGSVPSSHMQNLVRRLPFYGPVMKLFKKWADFVVFFAEHYRSWRLVMYSPEDHSLLGHSEHTPCGEQRLVANRFRETYIIADVERDRVKSRATVKYRELVLAVEQPSSTASTTDISHYGTTTTTTTSSSSSSSSSSRDTSSVNRSWIVPIPKNRLQCLAASRWFLTLNCVNYDHVLRQAARGYHVLYSELHPVQVDVFDASEPCSSALCLNQYERGRGHLSCIKSALDSQEVVSRGSDLSVM